MSQPQRKKVMLANPQLSKGVELLTLSDDEDVEGACAEGGHEMKMDQKDESAKSEPSSDESSSDDSSEDESVIGSGGEVKEISADAFNKLMNSVFRKIQKQKIKICCDAVDKRDGGSDESKKRKPKLVPFSVGLNGPLVVPDGAEPLDENYEQI